MASKLSHENSIEKDLERITKLLQELEFYEFLDSDHFQSFENFMCELYPDAFALYVENEFDGDDESVVNPSVQKLFEFVANESREQFINDFKNVVGYCCFSNIKTHDFNVEEIQAMREF